MNRYHLLLKELQKIWRPGILLCLLLCGFVFYTMFLQFYILYYPNGPQARGTFTVASQWVERYGTSLDAEEKAEAERQLSSLIEEADRYVASLPLCQQYGISTYSQFSDFYQQSVNSVSGSLTAPQERRYSDARIMLNYLQSEDAANIDGRIYAMQSYLQAYEFRQTFAAEMKSNGENGERDPIAAGCRTPKEADHAKRFFYGEDNAWQNILPSHVPETTSVYFSYLLIYMVLSAGLLTAPLLVRDKLCRMRQLQWSSRRGRRVLQVQFLAVILSAFLLSLLNLAVFGGLFAANHTAQFAACRLYSFAHTPFVWWNISYGDWCFLLMGLCVTIATATAALTFLAAYSSDNYIAMLLKLIVLFLPLAMLCPNLLQNLFYYDNVLYQLTGAPGIEILIAVVLFACALLSCIAILRAQKHRELLEVS